MLLKGGWAGGGCQIEIEEAGLMSVGVQSTKAATRALFAALEK